MRSLCKQRDPDLEVKDSVSETSPSRFLAAQLQGRVWKLEDFEILHELQKPITVVAPGVCHDQHRYHTAPVKKYVRRLNWQHLTTPCVMQRYYNDCQRSVTCHLPEL